MERERERERERESCFAYSVYALVCLCSYCLFLLAPQVYWSSRIIAFPCPEVLKHFPCSTQLSTKFILLVNVKMPTIVGILTFISMINTVYESFKAKTSSFVNILVFYVR